MIKPDDIEPISVKITSHNNTTHHQILEIKFKDMWDLHDARTELCKLMNGTINDVQILRNNSEWGDGGNGLKYITQDGPGKSVGDSSEDVFSLSFALTDKFKFRV